MPIFPCFNTEGTHKFYLFNFSDKFDGLIGLDLLTQLDANLNLGSYILKSRNSEIPIYFGELPKQKSPKVPVNYCYVIPPRTIQQIKVPVNVKEGYGILSYQQSGKIEIPESLIKIENYCAFTTALNSSEFANKINFIEPLTIEQIDLNQLNFTEISEPEIKISKELDNKLKANLRNLRLNHCNNEEKETIRNLCLEFRDIFHCEDIPLSFTNAIKHKIKLTDETPIFAKSYRYPEVHREEVKTQISKLLDQKIIRDSNSPFSAPIWIVPKKADASGRQKYRLVIDYRKLNQKSVDDKFPLPNITDILDKLGKAQYFTTLDLANGFHQIEMEEQDIAKTAFSTDTGHYEYLRMPFGLKNAPATFQRVMNNILRGLQNETCFVYLDDIIICSTSLQEHVEKLRKVFIRLRDAKFKIQLDKSEFLQPEVQYLGHIVTKDGIKPNPDKISAVKNFPLPKTQKDIKSFLGLIGYYRRFIKDFAKITKPMTSCLKKDMKVLHSPQFIEAFQHCKQLLINAPILQYPDFSKTFIVTTDASNFAIGAVLSQGTIPNDKPIAYISRTLNESETRYSTIEKELLSIVYACKIFRPYIFGRKFIIYTDHRPLVWLFNLKEPNSKLVRWRLRLEEYDYEIRHRKGSQNNVADALSRIQLNVYENESIINNPGDVNNDILDYMRNLAENPIQQPCSSDKHTLPTDKDTPRINIISDVIIKPADSADTVHSNQNTETESSMPTLDEIINNKTHQFLIKKNPHMKIKISFEQFGKHSINNCEIPNNRNLIFEFIRDYLPHDDKTVYVYFYNEDLIPIFTETYVNHFKRPKITRCTKLVNNVSNNEEKLLLIKHQHESKTNHRGINETYDRLKLNYYWPKMKDDVTQYINDCVTCQTQKYSRLKAYVPLVRTETPSKPFQMLHIDTFLFENQNFLTIIDKFSKFGQAFAYDKNAKSACDKLVQFFSFFGCPESITSDNGSEFDNELLKEMLKAQKINIHFTTPSHHESNSPVERFHSTIIEHLRLLRDRDPQKIIAELMPYAIIAYNSSIHSSTKFSPHELVLGHTNSRDPLDLISTTFYSDYVSSHQNKVNILYENAKGKTDERKDQIIAKVNTKGHEQFQFKINQKVYKKQAERSSKNKPKFKGPFKIIEILEHNRVKIQSVKNPRKTEIIHIKELKQPLVTDSPVQQEITKTPPSTTT